MADEGAQLGIQQEINKVLQERQAIMAASAKQLQDQIAIAQQLCDAMKCAGEDAAAGGEKMASMTAALQEAADAAATRRGSAARGAFHCAARGSRLARCNAGVFIAHGDGDSADHRRSAIRALPTTK